MWVEFLEGAQATVKAGRALLPDNAEYLLCSLRDNQPLSPALPLGSRAWLGFFTCTKARGTMRRGR